MADQIERKRKLTTTQYLVAYPLLAITALSLWLTDITKLLHFSLVVLLRICTTAPFSCWKVLTNFYKQTYNRKYCNNKNTQQVSVCSHLFIKSRFRTFRNHGGKIRKSTIVCKCKEKLFAKSLQYSCQSSQRRVSEQIQSKIYLTVIILSNIKKNPRATLKTLYLNMLVFGCWFMFWKKVKSVICLVTSLKIKHILFFSHIYIPCYYIVLFSNAENKPPWRNNYELLFVQTFDLHCMYTHTCIYIHYPLYL